MLFVHCIEVSVFFPPRVFQNEQFLDQQHCTLFFLNSASILSYTLTQQDVKETHLAGVWNLLCDANTLSIIRVKNWFSIYAYSNYRRNNTTSRYLNCSANKGLEYDFLKLREYENPLAFVSKTS